MSKTALRLLGVVLGVAVGTVLYGGLRQSVLSWGNRSVAPSLSAVASASAAPSVSASAVASASPRPFETWQLENDLAKNRKNAMIERCEKEGGAAAIGFGASVVCVKPMWVADPQFPEWSPL